MKHSLKVSRRISRFALAATIGVVLLAGCVSDDDVDKATTAFVQASTTLAGTYQALLLNANSVAENHYIDEQTYKGSEINGSGIQQSAKLTNAEIKLRTDAIKTLTDYTNALATLASNKPAAQIQTDAASASTSQKTLAADATTAFDTPAKGVKAPDFAGPVSMAATAIGDVLRLIESHASASEIRKSIEDNDPKITPLYQAIEKESADFFRLQQNALSETGNTLLSDYETARNAKPVKQVDLLQLSDRIKQYERDAAAFPTTNPTKAIADFEKSHAALVKVITTPADKKQPAVADLIAQVKSFVAEVKTPSKDSASPAQSN
jgi:outer membrane murein-binding lipoprotein Lpp